jgi:thiol-disulfide isomerase/thioredoxin
VAKSPPPNRNSAKTTSRGSVKTAGARPTKVQAGRPAGLFTWLAVGLVVLVVAVLVIIKVVGGSSATGNASFQAADATTVAQLTQLPGTIFDTVGVKSSVVTVTPPIVLKSQPTLTGTSSAGVKLPEVFYFGAEYCPFCAAERWSTIVALSRFGTWSGLGNMQSSTHTNEYAPGTPTFTFLKASYKSKYLVFKSVEQYTNVWSNSIGFYTSLQTPTATELANFKKYDTTKYIPGITANQNYSIPYISIGNQFIVSGASYTPLALANLTRSQIAAGLSDPTSPITDAIIASANYQTAALCTITKNQPGSVCTSSGVKAAKKVMGLK